MKFNLYRAFAMMIALFAAKTSVAQLSYYYQNGESKTEAMLSEQSSAAYVTQMTYYNFEFVHDRVHNCLTDQPTNKRTKFITFISRRMIYFQQKFNPPKRHKKNPNLSAGIHAIQR